MKRAHPAPAVPYAVRRAVCARSGGVCEIRRPVTCTGIATDMAHRWGQGVGGPDTACNVLHACRACHDYSGGHKLESYELGWQIRTTSPDPVPDLIKVLYRGIWMYLTVDGRTRPYTGEPTEGPVMPPTPTIPRTRRTPTPLTPRIPCLGCDPKRCDGAIDVHQRVRTGAVVQHLGCDHCGCTMYRRPQPARVIAENMPAEDRVFLYNVSSGFVVAKPTGTFRRQGVGLQLFRVSQTVLSRFDGLIELPAETWRLTVLGATVHDLLIEMQTTRQAPKAGS